MSASRTNTADQAMFYEDAYDQEQEDLSCAYCGGDGMDPMDDCMPCPECDGEGYRWWE